jgi:low temperature requirement protein LtrA
MSEDELVKRAGWLELFFDLVFVYAIAKTTHVIAHPHDGHISLDAYIKFALILVPVWWAWTGHTLFSTRFDSKDTAHRLLTLAQMLATLFLAAFINPEFDATYPGFLLSYLAIRLILVAMYLRAGSMDRDKSHVTSAMALGFGLGLVVAASSYLFPSPVRYFVLYAGIAIEVATPIFLRARLATVPVSEHHLPERFGLLTIILLGESVVALGAPMSESGLTAASAVAAVAGFVVLSAAWWIYFDLTDERIVGRELGHAQRIVYGHLPLYAGLAVFANFVRFALVPAINVLDHMMMGVLGTVLFVGALWFIHGIALWESPRVRAAVPILLVGSIILLVIGSLGVNQR